MEELKYEEIPELRKGLESLGVTTESQNRLPIFEPTIRAKDGIRVFEGRYGKLLIQGRLGQSHKNLLEVIFWKKEIYTFDEEDGIEFLKVAYDEMKIRKYLSQKSEYSYERYRELLKDMIRTYISLETNKLRIQGTLIMQIYESKVKRPTQSRSPIIPKEVPLTVIKFGAVATALFKNELRFTYDPKTIMGLRNGISQAVARFLKTHKEHPEAGYHLRNLIESLEGQIENKRWWKLREYLKEDSELLQKLGITIDFKNDRVIVAESHKRH